MLLDRDDHVAEHGRTAGAGDDEQIGEALAHQAEIGARTGSPFLVERPPAAAADIDLRHRPGHGIEAGGEHQRVEAVDLAAGFQAVRQDLLDRIGLDVNQRDVGAIVGRIVVGIDADPLRADRMIVGLQQLRHLGVVDDLGDPVADEVGGGVVGRLVQRDVVIGRGEGQAALLPARAVAGLPLFGRFLQRALFGQFLIDAVAHFLARHAAYLVVIGAEEIPLLRRQRRVARRHAEIGGALEHGELAGLLRDDRNRLDARRAGADHRDPLAGEIHRLVRPVPGVIDLAGKVRETLEVRHAGIGQAARRQHDELRPHGLSVRRRDRPVPCALVEHRALHAGIELDIRAEIEAIRDVVGIAQDFRLRRIALAPFPLLLQFVGEGIGILHAFDIAARAGIAVPVPGATDVAALLEHPRRQSEPAQPMQHVHAGKAGADNDDVVFAGLRRALAEGVRLAGRHRAFSVAF